MWLITRLMTNDEERFLQGWRKNLVDFEKRVLVPSFNGRISNIILVLYRMKAICVEERKNKILPHLFKAIHDQFGIPLPATVADLKSKEYLDRFEKVIDDDFLLDAESMQRKFSGDMTLDQFIIILEDLRNYCFGILSVKNKVFTYLIGFGGVILDSNGNYVKTVEPKENTMMWHPFNALYSEICSIAQSTIESINVWENEQLKVKNSFLNFKSHLSQLRGFRWSVAVAVVVSVVISWFFFVSGDYLKAIKYEIELKEKSSMVEQLQVKLKSVDDLLGECSQNLTSCKSE